MIEQWRKEWNEGDFPFYWVQLADYLNEAAQPGDSTWAELREAQTLTMKLPHTGQAVIIDLGEADNIHPRNKHDVAARLVRWALVKDYAQKFPWRSPEYKAMEVIDDKVKLTLDCFGGRLRTFDVPAVKGFAVCGEDHVWHWATGKVIGPDKVEVSCAEVQKPVALRYAWADNPVCNLETEDGLWVTPFRTDDFAMITKPKDPVPAPVPAAAATPAAPAPAAAPAAPAPAAPAAAPAAPAPAK
jgi:sialate O-acetylesterase